MDNSIYIRKATHEDRDIIVDLGKKTFVETYSEVTNNAALEAYVQKRFSPEIISVELDNPYAWFYIAFAEGTPVAFTKLRSDRKAKGLEHNNVIEIERIYVLKEYQGVKVGWEMMKKCKEIAAQDKYDVIWLQVWQRNNKAIQFYQKAGFVIYETTTFSYSQDIKQEDFLMRYNLYY
ncbi:MAG: GNAT family N-acetyltransferase [Agriterribacter sp.]